MFGIALLSELSDEIGVQGVEAISMLRLSWVVAEHMSSSLESLGFDVVERIVTERRLDGGSIQRRVLLAMRGEVVLRISDSGRKVKLVVIAPEGSEHILESEGLEVEEYAEEKIRGYAHYPNWSAALSRAISLAARITQSGEP